MASNSGLGWRAIKVGGSAVAVLGASFGLLANRRIAAVKSMNHPELDALMEVPTDVFHGAMATEDGGKVHYVDTDPDGSNRPTVVLLHGITNQWFTWSSVINDLRADHRVIAWDMRGFGDSEAGAKGVDLGAAAADLSNLLAELDLDGVVIVGHSMGGMVLGRFVADHPAMLHERVRGLQFLGTTGKSLGGSLAAGGLVRLTSIASHLVDHGVSGARLTWQNKDIAILLLRSGFGRVATAKMIDWSRRCQAETSERSFREGTHAMCAHSVLDQLAAASEPEAIPTHIMVGSLDRLTTPLHSYALQQAVPHATLYELEGVGHNVMYEDPRSISRSVRSLSSSEAIPARQGRR